MTTPIYYVNAEPHLGHAYTTIVGDALTRWHRLLGDDVTFLTGTDEYGLKIQRAAEDAGLEPQAFADSIAPKFAEAWKHLEIANDDFIRTTEPRHRAAVEELLQRCYDAGDIELDLYRGKYCVRCELYYSDDELLPGDLCPIHKLPVEEFEEENYFFRLSRFQDRLRDWYAAHPGAIVPEFRGNEALGLIRSGLRDFSVSRTSLTWGIPLPWDPAHVTYVWFDALTNYLSAVGFGSDAERFEQWWPVDYHLIGKDIIRQHCVYWPAMLMSAGLELPKGWAVGGWLLSGGEKMSKTTGNVVKPLDLVDTVGVDGFRYYVLADTPYGQDGDFTYEGLVGRYNADLANNLGNLAARVATVVTSKCGGVGPGAGGRQPARRAGGGRGRAERSPHGTSSPRAGRSTPRGSWCGRRTPTSRPTSRGSSIPARRSTPCSATPWRRCASSPCWRRRRCPPRRRRSGSASACPARSLDQRVPGDVAWGGYPGGAPGDQGPVAVPPDHRVKNSFSSVFSGHG